MKKANVYKIVDEVRNTGASDKLILDRMMNYLEANIDEFIECYEEEVVEGTPAIEVIKEKYIENGGTNCPHCGSDDIEAGERDFDGSQGWQNIICKCGKEWTDVYTLTGIDFIEGYDE